MILVDLSQILVSCVMVLEYKEKNKNYDISMVRHLILMKLLSVKKKFSKQYGELIICADDRDYWRKTYFPYYKQNRKLMKEESDIDWTKVMEFLNIIKKEIDETFPYKFIQVEHAEADDIIATLVSINGADIFEDKEDILIVSGDKDFSQLHTYQNVKQYDAVQKKFITCKDPKNFLFEHICRGDISDGIPNILTVDNFFMVRQKGDRQKVLSSKKLNNYENCTNYMNADEIRNFRRNEILIDLKKVPEEIRKNIIDKYNKPNEKNRSKLLNYFMKHRLKQLTEQIREF